MSPVDSLCDSWRGDCIRLQTFPKVKDAGTAAATATFDTVVKFDIVATGRVSAIVFATASIAHRARTNPSHRQCCLLRKTAKFKRKI